VKYCSSTCQTEDWASHKLVCKNIGAARKEELLPLLLAAENGDVATVEKLLKAGAKVDGGKFFVTTKYQGLQHRCSRLPRLAMKQ
jgi:hypothetical protein